MVKMTDDDLDFLLRAKVTKKSDVVNLAKILNRNPKDVRQTLNRIEKLRQQKLLEESSRTGNIGYIIDIVKQHVKPLQYIKPREIFSRKYKNIRTTPESAVLLLSDLHIGKKTESYNFDVFKIRLKVLRYSIHQIISILTKTYKIDKLYILMVGDIVEGESIYPAQSHYIDKEIIEQIFEGTPYLSEFILDMLNIFPEVEVKCIPGNHGRISKYTHKKNNFDTILYHTLESYLKNYKEIKFDVSENWWDVIKIKNHGFLLVHGGQIRGWLGIPFYGLIQSLMRWTGSLKEKFEYMLCGHFHVIASQDWNNKEILTNGTFVTDDDYALEVLKMASSPKQWFFGVHKDHGITWRYKVDLNI